MKDATRAHEISRTWYLLGDERSSSHDSRTLMLTKAYSLCPWKASSSPTITITLPAPCPVSASPPTPDHLLHVTAVPSDKQRAGFRVSSAPPSNSRQPTSNFPMLMVSTPLVSCLDTIIEGAKLRARKLFSRASANNKEPDSRVFVVEFTSQKKSAPTNTQCVNKERV